MPSWVRRVAASLLVALVAFGGLVAIAAPASADAGSEEAQFLALTNQLRASKGLQTLAVDGTLTSIARNWSAQMAAAGTIFHNNSLPNQVSAPWTQLGENVGMGPNVSGIQQAFIISPHHYENLVNPAYNYVGIGVVDSGGTIFVTVDFMALGAAPAPAPTAPTAPRTTTAPRPRTTTAPRATAPVTPRATVPAAPPTTAPPPPPPPPEPEVVVVPHPLPQVLEQLRRLDIGA